MSRALKVALFASALLVAGQAIAGDYLVVESHNLLTVGKVFRIYTAIERANDGTFKFSDNFELADHRYQVLGKRGLASKAEAHRLEQANALESCPAQDNTIVFRFVVGPAASRYTVVDHAGRRWGEFPDEVVKCPPAGAEPPVWNPVVPKAP